jgi:Tol biopolymer transport system component
VAAAVLATTAGAATSSVSRPLLTYAVTPVRVAGGHSLGRGLCATDLHGHSFRISDPRENTGPSWSPDGRSVAFTRKDGNPGPDHIGDVVVTDAQERHSHNLTRDGGYGSFFVFGWSPDSSELGISWRGRGTSISVAKADGTGERELVSTGYGNSAVGDSWSPDGRRILYTLWIGDSNASIRVIDVDGTNDRRLVDGAFSPVWSPDGGRFAYFTGGAGGLGVADANGGNAHLLLQGVNPRGHPAWSPDGSRLAYVDWVRRTNGDLLVVRADGGAPHLLARGVIGVPQWSPDGSLIAFARGEELAPGGLVQAPRIAVIKPDGSGERHVPTGGLPATDPVWRRAAALPRDRRPCVLRGNSRAGVIHGTGRGDVIDAGRGDDRAYGGGGDDLLIGGPGRDKLFGGAGADVLSTRDRTRDFLFGGRGRDTAYTDPVDVLSSIETFR